MGIRNLQCTIRGHRWDAVSEGGVVQERCVRCSKRRLPGDTAKAALVIRAGRNGGGAGL